MKIFIIFYVAFAAVFACSGDCASCHFSIDYKDERHKVMLDCKVCHTESRLNSQMKLASCGQDCFECHDIRTINKVNTKEHTALNTCITCHKHIDNKLSPNINPLFNNKMLNKKLQN